MNDLLIKKKDLKIYVYHTSNIFEMHNICLLQIKH